VLTLRNSLIGNSIFKNCFRDENKIKFGDAIFKNQLEVKKMKNLFGIKTYV